MDYIPVALSVAALWGSAPSLHKYLVNTIDFRIIMCISSMTYVACLAVLMAFSWNDAKIKEDIKKINIGVVLVVAAISLTTGFIAQLLYFYALRKKDSHIISALIYSSPLFTVLIAYFFLKEKISFIALIGILLIVSGIMCIGFTSSK